MKTKEATKARTKKIAVEIEPSATMTEVGIPTPVTTPKRKPGRPAKEGAVKKEVKKGQLGRRIDPNSERQKRENEKIIKAAMGIESKKGRTVDPNSKRQQELAVKEAKRKEGLLKKGRPTMDPELRSKLAEERKAKRDEEKQAKIAAIRAMQETNGTLETLEEVEIIDNE